MGGVADRKTGFLNISTDCDVRDKHAFRKEELTGHFLITASFSFIDWNRSKNTDGSEALWRNVS